MFGGTIETENEETGEKGDDLDLDNSASYGLIFNAEAEPNTAYEIYFGRQSSTFDSGNLFEDRPEFDVDISYLHIGGTVDLADKSNATPYLVATIGGTHMSPDDSELDSETFFSFSIGGGVRTNPESRFGLRLEGRFFGTVIDSDNSFVCRSGESGSGCLVRSKGDVLWQFQLMAGAIIRF